MVLMAAGTPENVLVTAFFMGGIQHKPGFAGCRQRDGIAGCHRGHRVFVDN
jgi:hypothetical protein